MNVELRGGYNDGVLLVNYGQAEPGRVIRVACLPLIKTSTWSQPPPMEYDAYVVTDEHNKTGDVIAELKR